MIPSTSRRLPSCSSHLDVLCLQSRLRQGVDVDVESFQTRIPQRLMLLSCCGTRTHDTVEGNAAPGALASGLEDLLSAITNRVASSCLERFSATQLNSPGIHANHYLCVCDAIVAYPTMRVFRFLEYRCEALPFSMQSEHATMLALGCL